MVGPIARIAKYPAHVISQSRKRCQRVKRPAAAVVWSETEVAEALTAVLYRSHSDFQQWVKPEQHLANPRWDARS